MSPRLALQFLGIPELILDNAPITTDRRKAIALLAYLGVNGGKYTREFLSGLLWPEYDQKKAFSNLRRTIWEVHQSIGESWLLADRESVRLNPGAELDLDVARFQDLLSQSHLQSDPELRISLLVECVKLYRNHFLTGFSLKDSYPFNEWAYAESEELRRQLASALTTLSEDYCTLGRAEKAIPHARRLISLDPLNETAHRQLMEIYLQAGQHSAAMKQYQTCEQILREELNLDPQPETRELYKKIRKREIKPIPVETQTEATTPKHNLPSQLSTFIGREKEQEEIIQLLAKNRLVTLAGMGGIGKTRLSLQVGLKLLNNYQNGVWFIALDSLFDPNLVPQTVAAVFEIREASDHPIIEILKNVLRDKTPLIILDNCEHLLDNCAQLITTLLTNCPNLKVLATSREILNMEGEAVYSLPSLTIPDDSASLEKLTNYESVQLFSDRASLVSSSFMLTNENAPTVIEICRKVDGIPLAIELAAAHLNIFQVKEILSQLNESLVLLASNGRRTLPRQQTLQASMDWSWGLLNESEQIFLRQLSVFAGGWTLDAAQTVCDSDVLSLTSALVTKSLIVVKQEARRETRYRFHEIVRQYARKKLVQAGEEEHARTQHLKYFLQFTERAESGRKGPTQIEWYARWEDERDNLRAALDWADQTDVKAGLYLSSRLHRSLEELDFREGSYWLPKFLQKPESYTHRRARAKALSAYILILDSLEQFDAALASAQECLALYRALGDPQGEVEGLLFLGWELTDPLERMALIQQALSLAQSLGDVRNQAKALWLIGWLDPGSKFLHWEKAITLDRQLGDWLRLADRLCTMGYFLLRNGYIDSAQKHLDEASVLNQQLNSKSVRAGLFFGYGQIALLQGDFERARAYYQENAGIFVEFGNRLQYLWARVHLGYIALREGNLSEARDIFAETAQDFQKDKNTIGVVFTLEGMVSLHVLTDRSALTARLIGWADATRVQIADTRPLLEQADVDKIISACIIKMGEAAFSDAYDEGQKMTMDEAVAYAFEN